MPRIMTYNIRVDTPVDGDRAWDHRKQEVATLLHLYQPDLIGMQEPRKHQVADLDAALPDYGRVGVGRIDGAEEGEFTLIYYRKDRLDVLEATPFWLSETPEVAGSKGWDAYFPRLVIVSRFRMRDSGHTFTHYNTHFDHSGEIARLESAKLLRARVVAQVANDRVPALITGDFNATTDSDVIKALLQPAERQDEPLKIKNTEELARFPSYGPTGTVVERFTTISPNKIDYIFLCQTADTDPQIEIKLHAVCADNRDGRYPSDHLPLVVDFEFEGK